MRPIPNPTSVQTSPEYLHWLKTNVWPIERKRRVALLEQIEGWGKEDAPVRKETVPKEVEEVAEEEECAPRRKRAT